MDENGIIIDANPATEKLLGYTKEELIGMDLNNLIVPDDRHFLEKFIRTQDTGKFPILFKGLKKDGTTYLGEVSSTKFFSVGGRQMSASLVRDLTDRSVLSEKVLNLTKAIECSPSTLVMTDIEGNITYVNPKFSEVTGYHYEEILGKNPRILKSGKIPTKQYKKMWETISKGNIWRGEFLNRTKNGDFYWEIASIAPVIEQCGKIVSYIKVAEVVTDLKRTIVNLWNILDYSNYFVVVVDNVQEIRLCNRILSKTLGFESEVDLVGKKWGEFIPEGAKDLTALIHRETIENKSGTVESTGEIVGLDGKVIVVKWFHSLVNSELDWVFSMGVPFNIDGQETVENVRTFYKEILAKDRTTIEAIKKRIYHEKVR
jgi:PAS domain S-box-containing protein